MRSFKLGCFILWGIAFAAPSLSLTLPSSNGSLSDSLDASDSGIRIEPGKLPQRFSMDPADMYASALSTAIFASQGKTQRSFYKDAVFSSIVLSLPANPDLRALATATYLIIEWYAQTQIYTTIDFDVYRNDDRLGKAVFIKPDLTQSSDEADARNASISLIQSRANDNVSSTLSAPDVSRDIKMNLDRLDQPPVAMQDWFSALSSLAQGLAKNPIGIRCPATTVHAISSLLVKAHIQRSSDAQSQFSVDNALDMLVRIINRAMIARVFFQYEAVFSKKTAGLSEIIGSAWLI